MIINHYAPGQGINPHVDKTHCFDDVVGSLGLGSSCIFEFRCRKDFFLTLMGMYLEFYYDRNTKAPYDRIDIFFERRTAVILSGEVCIVTSKILQNWILICGFKIVSVYMDARNRSKSLRPMERSRICSKESNFYHLEKSNSRREQVRQSAGCAIEYC